MSGGAWTAQERQQLVDELKKGTTFTQISAMLGRSRSSVAGRVMRDADLGITVPGRRMRSIPPPVQMPVQKLLEREPAPKQPKRKPMVEKEAPPPRDIYRPRPAPESQNVPLLALRPQQCKWPVHEAPKLIGGHAFCAAPVAWHGAPYCGFHQEVAAPAERRVRA